MRQGTMRATEGAIAADADDPHNDRGGGGADGSTASAAGDAVAVDGRIAEPSAKGKSAAPVKIGLLDDEFGRRAAGQGSRPDGAPASGTRMSFDDRVRQKIAQGGGKYGDSAGVASASRSSDQGFEDRLERKVNDEKTARGATAGATTVSDSANKRFNDRLKRKSAESDDQRRQKVAATERDTKSDSFWSIATASESSNERFNDHFKQKLSEEKEPKTQMASLNADDEFDDRLGQKLSEEGNTNKKMAGSDAVSSEADDRFDDRLKRKVSQECNTKNNLDAFASASNAAQDRFDDRLKQKVSKDDELQRGSVGCSPARDRADDMKVTSSAEAQGGGSKTESECTNGPSGSIASDEDVIENRSNDTAPLPGDDASNAEPGDVHIAMEGGASAGPNTVGGSIAADGEEVAEDGRASVGRASSTLQAHVRASSEYLVSATLVEDGGIGEVVVAERVGIFERKGKLFAFVFCLVITVLIVALPVSVNLAGAAVTTPISTDVPSMSPSMPPSFDPRPTLEIVQQRGVLRCGFTTPYGENMCRAAASVILGDPNSCEQTFFLIPRLGLVELEKRSLDMMIEASDTVSAGVKEVTTGASFTFSAPFAYDDVFFRGNRTFVECAENGTRHGICSSLRICINPIFPGVPELQARFPPKFYLVDPGDHVGMMLNGTCNVLAFPFSFLSGQAWKDLFGDDNRTVIATRQLVASPWGIATRHSDKEFSDVINWVRNTLIYADEHRLGEDTARCQNYTNFPQHASALNFMNAVHCVGNHSLLTAKWSSERALRASPRNHLDDGTGLIFATPLGPPGGEDSDDMGVAELLNDIANKGPLQCGVVVPNDFEGDATTSDGLVGMSSDFCRALAAALFSGNPAFVNVTGFSNDEGFVALNHGAIDVLAGGKVKKKYDFANPSLGLEGFDFSTPYFFGNESIGNDLSIFALATREDNRIFSLFANSVVLAPIIAQGKAITREQSNFMPLMSWFGSDFGWALRDVVQYTGSYDQLYEKHFGAVPYEERGRNRLNEGGPLLYSIPGLSHGSRNESEED